MSGYRNGIYYLPNQYNGHGFIFANGGYTTVDYPGAAATYLGGLNDSGTIVGSAVLNNDYSGFLYNQGTFSLLNYPGAQADGCLNAISSNGKIVGSEMGLAPAIAARFSTTAEHLPCLTFREPSKPPPSVLTAKVRS